MKTCKSCNAVLGNMNRCGLCMKCRRECTICHGICPTFGPKTCVLCTLAQTNIGIVHEPLGRTEHPRGQEHEARILLYTERVAAHLPLFPGPRVSDPVRRSAVHKHPVAV